MSAADWVQRNLKGRVLTAFQRDAVELLGEAMNTGIYNVQVRWDRADWNESYVKVNLFTGGLSTFDFDHLTRFVLAAHDRCIRVDLIPVAPRYMGIFLSPRVREVGGNWSRIHPTIEEAIAKFRGGA